MALPSGLARQIGYANETVYGTFVAPTRFVPLLDEELTQEVARLESEGAIAGAQVIRSEQWSPGAVTIEGDVGHELYQQGLGLLFRHMFGAVNTTGSGPYTHTFTFGTLTGLSFTTQVGVPQTNGTVAPKSYTGCKVASWEIAMATEEIVTLGLTLIAQAETRAQALATATYLTGGGAPFTYRHGAVTIDGVENCVREITLECDNGLSDERRCIGQAGIDEPLQNARREVTGSATIEFANQDHYDRYVNGEEFPMILAFDAGAAAQCTITMNVRYDGATPTAAGDDLVVVEYPFKAIAATTDASAVTAVLINNQATL